MRARQLLWTAENGWTGKSDLVMAIALHNQTTTITVFGECRGA